MHYFCHCSSVFNGYRLDSFADNILDRTIVDDPIINREISTRPYRHQIVTVGCFLLFHLHLQIALGLVLSRRDGVPVGGRRDGDLLNDGTVRTRPAELAMAAVHVRTHLQQTSPKHIRSLFVVYLCYTVQDS